MLSKIKSSLSRTFDRVRAKILEGLIPKDDELKVRVAKALLNRNLPSGDPIVMWDDIYMQGYRIRNVGTPIEPGDVATKDYVDQMVKPIIVVDVDVYLYVDVDINVTEITPTIKASHVTPHRTMIPADVIVELNNPSDGADELWYQLEVLREDGVFDVIQPWTKIEKGVVTTHEFLINQIYNKLTAGKRIKGVYLKAYYVGTFVTAPKVGLRTKSIEFLMRTT